MPKEIWEKLLTVNSCLDFVIANENWAQKEEERMTEEQKTETMKAIDQILVWLKEKVGANLTLRLMIVQFKFDLFFGRNNQLETQLEKIAEVFES